MDMSDRHTLLAGDIKTLYFMGAWDDIILSMEMMYDGQY